MYVAYKGCASVGAEGAIAPLISDESRIFANEKLHPQFEIPNTTPGK